MDNSNLQWRVWAKIIAVLDLIFSILFMLSVVILIIFVGIVTVAVSTSNTKVTPEEGLVAWVILVAVLVLAIITMVSIWAAVQLVKATELGREAKEAHKFCQIWRVVSIVGNVVGIIFVVLGSFKSPPLLILCAIQVVIRFVFIYVVHRFMRELKTVIISGPRQMKHSQNV